MEKSLNLYIDINGKQVDFPQGKEQIVISAFTADYKRMGNAPTITCTVKYPTCLDNEWTYGVYTEFNGERFYLKQIPSSSFSNKDARYIHELELCSERVQLDHVFVFDVTSGGEAKPVSNNTEFSFFGTIREFAEKLNSSLKYSGLQSANGADGYRVIVDDGVESEGALISIDNRVFSEVLQDAYNIFEVPYYFVGKEIHLGYSSDVLLEQFKYGSENSLLSIQKQNANAKIVNRITAFGSEDNIPYYYPNKTSLGDVYLTYNGQENKAVIGDQAKFSKNKLSNVFRYHYRDELRYNIMGNLWSVQVLKEHKPSIVDYYARKSFKIVETSTTGEFIVSFNSGYIYEGLKPHFKLSNVETEEIIGEWDGEYTTSQFEFDWSGSPTTITNYDWFSLKKFYTLTPAEYQLEITYTVNPIGFNRTAQELFEYFMFVELSYYSPKENYWLLENKAISFLSDYGITTLVEPKDGDTIEIKQNTDTWLVPQKKLMPPKYRETLGAERFYNATNETYVNPETDDDYTFTNVYVEGNPREHIAEFEEIKPTIVGITNKDGKLINSFSEFAYDDKDNDEKDEEGNYIHPYFFAKLRKLDGDHGFNLFHHAIESGEMTISMTSGSCGGCQWVIGVDADGKFNSVQVNEDGTLKRDAVGDVICGREGQAKQQPQEQQQDTINNEVWIALKKDNQTFHTIMPNATNNYKPSVGDTFVILNIHLPHSYILAAEQRLEEEMIRYMAENNEEKFNFSVDFSRIYLAEHQDVLEKLNENARIKIVYNGIEHLLYVTSFSYKMQDNASLPEIKVELADKVSIGSNAIQQAVTQVETKMQSQLSNLDVVALASPYFHRKDVQDSTNFSQDFKNGINVGSDKEFGINKNGVATLSGVKTRNFTKGLVGASFYEEDGNTFAELDYINVRKKATFKEVEIEETKHIGGKLELTAAECKCDVVEYIKDQEDNVVAFKVYFRRYSGENELITNKWQVGDQARCDTFNLEQNKDGSQGNRYYWRLVTEVGTGGYALDNQSMAEYHWIVLSNKESETITLDGNTKENEKGFDAQSSAPLSGDSIIQLGNRFGTSGRTSAIELAGAGTDSPYIRQYEGITTFTLGDVDTQIKPGDNKFKGRLEVSEGSKGIGLFSDLPDEVNNAVKIGGENLLRNTGFDGDYASQKMEEFGEISETDLVYGQRLEFWEVKDKVTVVSVECSESVSGYACEFKKAADWLKQPVYLIKDEFYVLSFMCKGLIGVYAIGNQPSKSYGDAEETTECRVDIIGDGEQQFVHFISLTANATLWNVKLERGRVKTDWCPAREDNDEMTGEFKDLWYLQHAFKGKTEILGGLILSSLIQLGKYENGILGDITAGMSGIVEDPNTDVAFWGGGTMQQAMDAVNLYKYNPNYQPTDDEVNNIAKVVITHAGRAILNEVVLRGYIYALGGVFRGRIEAKEGYFLGNTRNIMVDITPDNIHEYALSGDGTSGNQYYLDFDKTGFCFRFSGRFNSQSVYIQLPYMTPFYPAHGVERDDLRATNFNRVLIFNNGDGIGTIGVGVTLPNGAGSTYPVRFGEVFEGSANLVYSYDGVVGEGLLWSVKVHRNEIEDEEPQPISPKIYAYGSVASDGSISYTSFDENQVSCAKQTTSGQYIVTFSSSWFNSADDYIVSLTGVGFVEDSNSSPVKATLLGKTKSSITVCTSDDATPNDGAFDFIIMKK